MTVLALVALSGSTTALSFRLSKLGASYQRLGMRLALPYPGYLLPTFAAGTVAGDSLLIAPPDRRQLIFEFNSACPYCQATLPVWRSLADSARRIDEDIEIIGLSLDSFPLARQHAITENLKFPVATFPSRKMRRLSKAGTVPQTLVLDGDGLVLYAHAGLLTPSVLDSIYRALAGKRLAPDSFTRTSTAAVNGRQ